VGLGLATGYQAFFDAPTREALFPPAGLLGLELSLHQFFRRDWTWSFDLAFGSGNGRIDLAGTPLPFRFSETTVGSSLLAEWPLGDFVPYVGARLALLLMGRQFSDASLPRQGFATWSPGLVLGARYRVVGGLGVTLRTRLHYVLYNVDENRSLGYWELGGLVTYEL
jgi:hypothetical protein